jgi:hypothetical protein
LHMYVSCVWRFRCMLQLFHMDVAKSRSGDVAHVAYVAIVLEACCKCMFRVFHMF